MPRKKKSSSKKGESLFTVHRFNQLKAEIEALRAQLEAATGIRAACWGHANCRSRCDYWDELADRDTAQRAFGSEREEQRGQLDWYER